MSVHSRNLSTRRNLLLTAGAFSLVRPLSAGAATAKTFRLAHALPRTHPVHQALEHFVARVTQETGGEITMDIFAEGELGQEVQLLDQARMGRLDFVKVSASVIERACPVFSVFNLPFVLRDREHWQAVTTGSIGEAMLASTLKADLIGLAFYEAGSRSFYAQKAINHPDDLKGLRIRIQPSSTMQRLVELFGARPVQLAWDLTYDALSNGLVDGAENSVVALVVGRHGEVVKYYCYDEHTMVPDVFVASAHTWAGLSEGQRSIIRESAAASQAVMSRLWASFAAEAERKVTAMGVTFVKPNKQPFVDRAAVMTVEADFDGPVAELLARIRRV